MWRNIRFGCCDGDRFPSLVNPGAYLRLRVSMDQRLCLKLNLVLDLLLCGFLILFGGTGSNDGGLRTSIYDCLCLDLGQGGNLGSVHRHETPPPIFRRSDDGLRLGSCLHHRLCLRLNHFGGYVCLLPLRCRSLKLRLQLRLKLRLNLLL